MALMLTVLAVLDTGILWVDMSHDYLRRIHGIHLRKFSNLSCKMHRYIVILFAFCLLLSISRQQQVTMKVLLYFDISSFD